MPLRTAPLPRMAGDLTFMRSRRATLEELSADNLAILGAPIEDNLGRKSGTRFTPTALRETSVYFGWHANPQFSHPVDIDVRIPIDTSKMHGRLVDIGDIPLEGMPAETAVASIGAAMNDVRSSGASVILIGGDDSIVEPAITNAGGGRPSGFLQIGGRLPASLADNCNKEIAQTCPLGNLLASGDISSSTAAIFATSSSIGLEFAKAFRASGGRIWTALEVSRAATGSIEELAREIVDTAGPLHVHFDVSAIRASLHGMSENPQFGGLSLPDLQKVLGEIGRASVASLIVTGLNPTLSGLSVVKTGLRLTVTALLAYIYSRLGLEAAQRPRGSIEMPEKTLASHWPRLRPPGPTLFDAPIGSVDTLDEGVIGVVGMPTDWTHSSRIGAREGPVALRMATTEIARSVVDTLGDTVYDPNLHEFLRRADRDLRARHAVLPRV